MLVPSAGRLLLRPPAEYSTLFSKSGIFSLAGTCETSQNLSEHPPGVPAPPSNLVDVELKALKGWQGDRGGVS